MKLHVKANDRNSILKYNLVKPLDAATESNLHKWQEQSNLHKWQEKSTSDIYDLTVKEKYFIRYKGKTMIKHRKKPCN